jgi:hypothetical protein
VSWPEHDVSIKATRRAIEMSPQYDPSQPISPEYEAALHDHHGRTK